jgi:ligand-binding sensor domain-containing protein
MSMTVVRQLPILTLLLSLALNVYGLKPDRDIHHLAHRSWDEKDGYPGYTAALAQTTDGFLWIGTDNGLFRFDGVHFERYVSRSGDKLSAGPVRGLLATPDGHLWIAYRLENKICVLWNDNVRAYSSTDGVTSNPTTIVQDRESTIWANTETGVIRFNGTRWEHVGNNWNFPESVPNLTSDVLFVDSRGTLWAGVNNTILYLKRGSRRFEPTGAFAGWSTSIAEAPDGTMWLADVMSSVRAISTSVSAKLAAVAKCEAQALKGTPVNCGTEDPSVVKARAPVRLLFDRNGNLWVTTDTSGVVRIPFSELPRNRLTSNAAIVKQTFSSRDGLSADTCTPILEDREGNIWVGTRDGIDQFRDAALVPVVLPKSLYRVAVAPAAGGDIWVVGSWAYVGRTHGDSSDISFLPNEAAKPYRDDRGSIWLLGDSLQRWENGRFRIVTQSPYGRGGGPGTWQVASDKSGTLWAFSNGHGFFSLDHDHWKPWVTPPAVAMQRVVNMFSDSSGRIWVATYEGDIITMNRGTIMDYSVKRDSPVSQVKAFAERAPGQIWAGGQGGLVLIDNGKFHSVQASALDCLEDVTGIVDAGDNGLWLNTAIGVIHVSRNEVDRALRDPSYRFQCQGFDSSDGLPGLTETIYPYPKAVQGTDGRIWFTASRGLAWIDPKETPRKNAVPPPVHIERIVADGKQYGVSNQLRLPPGVRDVSFDYTALSLAEPEKVRFRYRLEGQDPNWREGLNVRQVQYSNLPPGDYRFRVIASNNSGVWNKSGATVALSIDPAYY